jgi:hypothetical protein
MEKLNMRISLALASLLTLSSLGSGCAAYQMDTPTGFALVSENKQMAHYKGGDDVGLNVRVFGNVKGGTLDFWGNDLVTKLGRRGYTLDHTAAVTSRNGVAGRRLDFTYAPDQHAGKQTLKAYSVVLFATEDHRVIVQLAGDPKAQANHRKTLDHLASQIKISS